MVIPAFYAPIIVARIAPSQGLPCLGARDLCQRGWLQNMGSGRLLQAAGALSPFPGSGRSVLSHAVPVYCASKAASGQAFFYIIPGMAYVDLVGSSFVLDVRVPTTAVQLIATVTGRSGIATSAVL